ncbi:peptidase family m20 m25 m40 protein [Diplodia corticola]|uniref:Peptidase family m20 m25 m40 protein n=1 Tax=Diplodia corticola TaxID=236234 RepID=A0A1J9QU93_9PEZI|nr:peptidase family m20 m25 m40 protein [Diplodia corticola]OJD32016.1 peptidase family m20 m25 m40 protein [Diplodia corticola]
MAEDDQAAESVGSRRGQKTLLPLQTQLDSAQVPHSSRWRRSRFVVPPPPEHKVAPPPPQPAPDPPAKLENRKSTMSLFSLFSRPRVERARGHHEIGLPTIPDGPEAMPTAALSPVAATPQTAPNNPADPSAVAPKSRGSSFNRRSRTGGSSNWEPPPLFQVYPQALKHAMLQATNSSAEAIISTQAHKRQYSILRENLQSKLDLSNGSDETSPAAEKLQKREKRMSTSSTLAAAPPDMTHKIYVLSTSGYLLQYSGEGPAERMPEKILQLGKDSAAFACDLIPGKHWVLQISQSTTDDGTVTAQQPRSLLSRLRMQGTAAKRTATTLLLVFDTPEEMGEWLTAIRQEIDILAGRKTRSEVDQENSQENGLRKHTKMPSHRYYVQRDPNRFDNERSPLTSPVGSPAQPGMEWSSATMRRNVSDAASTTSRFTFKRRSVEGSSMATTSYDGNQLNQLREDSRLSMASNRTSGTSPPASTGPPSPVRDSTPRPGDESQLSPTTLKSFSMSPSTSTRRRSMPMQPLSPTDEDQPHRSQRQSPFDAALAGARQSPAPPSEDGHKSPTPDGSAPRTIKNRMSFSRPFNLHVSHSYTPMPTIRSASAPPEKMAIPAGQAVSTDTAESVCPPSTIGSLAYASNPSANSTQRQTPSPNPGFRPIPIRPTTFMPARRISSLGPTLPVNVNPTPALRQRASQPQLPTQTPPQLTTRPPSKTLPPMRSPPPTLQLPPTPQQPQSKQQPALRRPTSMQIRSEPAAFLSTRRPMGVSARNRSPSLEPPVRPSSARPSSAQAESTRFPGQVRFSVHQMRSMPALGLPPPAPPPNMPLPAPPPNAPLPPLPSSDRSTTTIKTVVMA